MGQVRNLLRGMAFDSLDGPARLLSRLDAALRGLQLDTLATALVARVEHGGTATRTPARTGTVRPPAALVQRRAPAAAGPPRRTARSWSSTRSADLMLGIDPTTDRTERVLALEPGATVLLYTDGLVERRATSLDTCIAELRERFEQVGRRDPGRGLRRPAGRGPRRRAPRRPRHARRAPRRGLSQRGRAAGASGILGG